MCFLANRAHHAEMGGVTPGSMPAGSTMLSEEGVVLNPQYLFKEGVSQMSTGRRCSGIRKVSFPAGR